MVLVILSAFKPVNSKDPSAPDSVVVENFVFIPLSLNFADSTATPCVSTTLPEILPAVAGGGCDVRRLVWATAVISELR